MQSLPGVLQSPSNSSAIPRMELRLQQAVTEREEEVRRLGAADSHRIALEVSPCWSIQAGSMLKTRLAIRTPVGAIRVDKRKQKELSPRQQRRWRTRTLSACSLLAIPLLLSLLLISASEFQLASATPPVDYLIYTSQLATAQSGTQSVSSILPSVQSIYAPTTKELATNSSSAEAHLLQLANRVLQLVRNSTHSHDNNQVDLEAVQYAWSLMERQAELYMRNRVVALRPFVQELLAEAQLTPECTASISSWMDNLTELKQWATLMWNSWGQFPPVGIFQGSYTDLGSYSGCMSIKGNELIGESQYCMLDFQPIVPTRPRFHSIFKRILNHNEVSQKLDHGDFELQPPGSGEISSLHAAHGFASHRFKELAKSYSSPVAGSGSSSSSSSSINNNSKYLKRTIDQQVNRTSGDELLGEPLREPDLNITLKAEALIELAKKAQYFYYVYFRIGACLPSKCSTDDVKKLAQSASQRAVLQSISVNCMKKEKPSLNTYQLVAIVVLSSLALIAVIGAVVDLLGYKENPTDSSALVNWLLPFSLWTNAKRLFDLDTAGSHGDLECIHGLRFFSMVWVIYGHTILYLEYQSFTHFYDVVETQIPSIMLLPSLNANFSVDTFFVISGMLTTYVTWEYTKGDARKFNKFAFMISRYIRLTPQLAIVILCFFIMPLFGDGPMYRAVANEQAEVCYKNWVVNLLYLQSYVNADKHCIDPSWWLSIEMTFHVVSVLVIIVMINNSTRGMWINFLVAAAFTLAGAAIHYTNGFAIQYLPSIPQRFEIREEQTQLFFHRPYPHAASYFIGIALGYLLANRTIKKLTSRQVIQGWTVCAFGLITSLWGAYYWNLGAPYTQLQATIYYNLCQVLWPISIAWIILACSLGHGGFVDGILSARCFVPLGRITYMTYLSHSLIIYYHSARMNMTVEPSMLFFTYLFIANAVIALFLGIVLTLVYESPILNLQKQLFTYLTQKFDPTIRSTDRQGSCLPTRLQEGDLRGRMPKQAILAGGNTIVLDEATVPLDANGSISLNGYMQNATSNGFNHHNEANMNDNVSAQNNTNSEKLSTPTAQCLLLKQNNDKKL